MRRLFVTILAVCALAAACGGKGNPTEPSSSTGPSSASSSSVSPPAAPPGNGGGAAEAEVKGTIEALPPTTAPLTFRAAGRTVVTNGSTVFKDGSIVRSFAGLKLGMRVEVKGTASDGAITGARVEIGDAEEDYPPAAPQNRGAEIN